MSIMGEALALGGRASQKLLHPTEKHFSSVYADAPPNRKVMNNW